MRYISLEPKNKPHNITSIMIALTSATGKLGGAVLNAILDNKLIDPKELVVCVRSPAPPTA
jgi:uncharacterized protein YbjT (DUF2867 family)